MNRSEIRFAEPEDLPVLSELLLKTNQYYWGFWDGAKKMTAASAKAIIEGRSGCKAVIAWVDGVPSAVATITVLHPAPNENGTLFMKDLFVVEHARGTGIGKRIMWYLARFAVQHGCQRFDWTAEQGNPKAVAFYAALGADRVEDKIYFRFNGEELAKLANRADDDG